MDVAITLACPILEGNAELECRAGGANEIGLVDAHVLMEGAGGRNCGFTDADGPDLVRFDERDIDERPELLRQRVSSDPAGGAPARDHHAFDRLPGHFSGSTFA